MIVEHGLIGFISSFMGGILIVLHLPACDIHWADKLPFLSKHLRKHHDLTLRLAVFFAFIHIILALLGLFFDVWI